MCAKFADFFKFIMSPNFQNHSFTWNWILIIRVELSFHIKTPYLFSKFKKGLASEILAKSDHFATKIGKVCRLLS